MIFENIVHYRGGPLTPEIEQDLGLLAITVTYFAEMRSQMRLLATVCFRLQHSAAVFLQLAQAHVSRYASSSSGGGRNTESSWSIGNPPPQASINTPQGDSGQDGITASMTWGQQAKSNVVNGYAQAREALTAVDMEEMDITSYLEWLPSNMDDSTWPMFEAEGPYSRANGDPLAKNVQNRRQKFESVFDWFSWDSYYAGNNGT